MPKIQNLDPKTLVPTQSVRTITQSEVETLRSSIKSKTFKPDPCVEVYLQDGIPFIVDGHHRSLATSLENVESIKVEVYSEAELKLNYIDTVNKSNLYDWEDIVSTDFSRLYPKLFKTA